MKHYRNMLISFQTNDLSCGKTRDEKRLSHYEPGIAGFCASECAHGHSHGWVGGAVGMVEDVLYEDVLYVPAFDQF